MRFFRASFLGLAVALTFWAVPGRAADEKPAAEKKALPPAKEILERWNRKR